MISLAVDIPSSGDLHGGRGSSKGSGVFCWGVLGEVGGGHSEM